jgi:flagellar protein FliL
MSAPTMVPDIGIEPDAPSRGRRKLIIVLILAIVLGGSAGAAGWWFFLRDVPPAEAQELEDGEIIRLEPLTTTLGESTLRHARVAMAVVLAADEDPVEAALKAPELQDALLREVAKMDADELRSAEGSERLRQQLTSDAKRIWGEEVVRRVLLTELLVQ